MKKKAITIIGAMIIITNFAVQPIVVSAEQMSVTKQKNSLNENSSLETEANSATLNTSSESTEELTIMDKIQTNDEGVPQKKSTEDVTVVPISRSVLNSMWGTSSISFDDITGVLKIGPGQLGETDTFPWPSMREDIKEIVLEPGVIAPENSQYLFGVGGGIGQGGFPSANKITGLENLNTSQVINMQGMFADSAVTNLSGINNWDTSKVQDMSVMFYRTRAQQLNINSWNTTNVKNMKEMFWGIQTLTQLDLSSWNIVNVTDMTRMFTWAKLQELNISNWDITSLKNLTGMFMGTSNLSTLILGTNTIFNSTTELPAVDTTSGQYSGGWVLVSPVTPSSVYQSSDLFMTNYDGSAPGTYVWQINKAAVVSKDSTLHVGDKWKAEDNFVSATDAFGNPLSY
ncbi:BspA family leucine-rich repeat surface protein, partial [Enterococcus faecalis]|nr:BspA family leucine-rich repeat surface protein [Enterococcus faecalis]